LLKKTAKKQKVKEQINNVRKVAFVYKDKKSA